MIMEAMLGECSLEKWKGKSLTDLLEDLATVQTKMNEARQFAAAIEFQGLIEIVEVANRINTTQNASAPWLKKAVDDMLGIALKTGRKRRGQTLLWSGFTKQLLERMAEIERMTAMRNKPATSGSNSPIVEIFPCQNCMKGGLLNQMHTITECSKRGNVCRLECRSCPLDPNTGVAPCHWRAACPNWRKRERSFTYKNFDYKRQAL